MERLSRFTSAQIRMRERRAEPFLGLVVLGGFLGVFPGLSTDFLAALVCSLVSCLTKESSIFQLLCLAGLIECVSRFGVTLSVMVFVLHSPALFCRQQGVRVVLSHFPCTGSC